MFLKLEGIEGESQDDKQKNEIEINRSALGGAEQRLGNGDRRRHQQGGAGHALHQDIDKSSPNLFGVLTPASISTRLTPHRPPAGGEKQVEYCDHADALYRVVLQHQRARSAAACRRRASRSTSRRSSSKYTTQNDKGTGGPVDQ
jgi:hypothetical protein